MAEESFSMGGEDVNKSGLEASVGEKLEAEVAGILPRKKFKFFNDNDKDFFRAMSHEMKKALAYLVIGTGIFASGYFLGDYMAKPRGLNFLKDIDEDGRDEYFVKSYSGNLTIFLNKNKGFFTIDNYYSSREEALKKMVRGREQKKSQCIA
jgi:hypothetical protein